ncbi:MAG: VOC family protein [Geothrix sp.]|nr:VOC family protein [Geothrix sp.]
MNHPFLGIRRAAVLALMALLGMGAARPMMGGVPREWPALGDAKPIEHHPGKMIWADLVTPDLAAAERFYGGMFGWTFETLPTRSTRYVVASLGGHPVGGLLQRTAAPGAHHPSAWLTFFAVGDVDAARRTALKEGAKVVSEPKTYPGRGRQAVLADPEGAVFAVLASSTGDPSDFLAAPGEWIWSSLLARDPARDAVFYQNLFHYEVFDLPNEDGADHVIFSSEDYARASANTLPGDPTRHHPHWLNFVRVADTSAAAAKAVGLGGRILVKPHLDRHGGRAAVVADPAGAPIGLMEWSDSDSKGGPK